MQTVLYSICTEMQVVFVVGFRPRLVELYSATQRTAFGFVMCPLAYN